MLRRCNIFRGNRSKQWPTSFSTRRCNERYNAKEASWYYNQSVFVVYVSARLTNKEHLWWTFKSLTAQDIVHQHINIYVSCRAVEERPSMNSTNYIFEPLWFPVLQSDWLSRCVCTKRKLILNGCLYNRERGTANGERRTANGERGTGISKIGNL